MHQLYSFLFSPHGGGWGYPYLGLPGLASLVVIAALVPLTIFITQIAARRIASQERTTVAALLAYGLAAQLVFRVLAPVPMAAIVESPGANAFFDVARTYGPAEYLNKFQALTAQLPMHARANLPGKTLLYHAFLAFTQSSQVIALLIVLLSTCGAAMVYFLAKQWFGDQRAALCAMTLYLFMPARIYFTPVMNVVTPLFLLLPMCLLELYFNSRRVWLLAAAGVAAYGLLLFEPLPFAAAPVVIARLWFRTAEDGNRSQELARIAAYSLAGFGAAYVVMRLAFGFDAFAAFAAALNDAREFNVANARPYGLWAAHNLIDVLMHMGIGVSVVMLIALVRRNGDSWLAWGIATALLVLTVLGVNRGEVARLWIFLGVLMQIAAAKRCATDIRVFRTVVAVSIVQAAILLPSVGWITVESVVIR